MGLLYVSQIRNIDPKFILGGSFCIFWNFKSFPYHVIYLENFPTWLYSDLPTIYEEFPFVSNLFPTLKQIYLASQIYYVLVTTTLKTYFSVQMLTSCPPYLFQCSAALSCWNI